jgi:hypothetical protein
MPSVIVELIAETDVEDDGCGGGFVQHGACPSGRVSVEDEVAVGGGKLCAEDWRRFVFGAPDANGRAARIVRAATLRAASTASHFTCPFKFC